MRECHASGRAGYSADDHLEPRANQSRRRPAEARARGDDDKKWAQAFDQSVETERRERDLAIIEAELGRLALLPDLAYQLEREATAERLRLTKSVLDKHVKAKRPRKAAESAPIFDPDKLQSSAGHIIHCADILELFTKDFAHVIAGEEVNGKLLYLVATSRLFAKPMNAAIKGTSAGGKSEIRKRILAFFPPEDVVTFTSLSEKALIYYDGDFTHKILSMGEAIATEEKQFQDYLLRELMSEGHIRHSAPQKIGNDIQTVNIEKHGPVSFLVTTTKNTLHPENETRMLSLEIDDSEKQTRNVLDKVAEIAGLQNAVPVDHQPWQDFQRWLAIGERRAVVPFAAAMVELIPPVAVRLRRDVGQVIAAIQTHALLHRNQRGRDEAGRIIADIDHDYDAVRKLMNAILAEGSGTAVNPAMTETIEAVIKATIGMADDQGVDAKGVAKLLKLDRSATWRRLSAACDEGYVCNLEQRRRMPGKYRVTGQKVEPVAILPATAKLNDVCASTPLKSVHSCNREEIAEVSLGDNECKPHLHTYAHGALADADRVHECSSVQTDLATDNSLNGNEESPPVARLHEFSGGYEEEECVSAAAIESSPDDDLPLVCDHCGEPATASSPVQSCWVDGEEFLLHRDCQTDWLRKTDDLGIPPLLKREPGS